MPSAVFSTWSIDAQANKVTRAAAEPYYSTLQQQVNYFEPQLYNVKAQYVISSQAFITLYFHILRVNLRNKNLTTSKYISINYLSCEIIIIFATILNVSTMFSKTVLTIWFDLLIKLDRIFVCSITFISKFHEH